MARDVSYSAPAFLVSASLFCTFGKADRRIEVTNFTLPSVPKSSAETLEVVAFLEGCTCGLSQIHEAVCGLFRKQDAQILLISHALSELSATIATLRTLRKLVEGEG